MNLINKLPIITTREYNKLKKKTQYSDIFFLIKNCKPTRRPAVNSTRILISRIWIFNKVIVLYEMADKSEWDYSVQNGESSFWLYINVIWIEYKKEHMTDIHIFAFKFILVYLLYYLHRIIKYSNFYIFLWYIKDRKNSNVVDRYKNCVTKKSNIISYISFISTVLICSIENIFTYFFSFLPFNMIID